MKQELHLLDPYDTVTETPIKDDPEPVDYTKIIIIVIASAICLFFIIGGCFCRLRKKNQIENDKGMTETV